MCGRMGGMRFVVLAWVQFIGGLVVLVCCDYYVRWRDGWLGNSGFPTPDVIWFGVPILLGIIALLLLWRGTGGYGNFWSRAAIIAIQAAIGFLVYMALCL